MSSAATQTSAETIAQFDRYVVPNYRRYPVCLVRGEGSYVWDAEGRRFLDFFPGWGCNMLGHCPPRVVEAIRDQVGQLIHIPNTWYIEAQGAFAQLLSERSFGGQCFFCNSGAEANEAAIKMARAYGHPQGRYKIITMEHGFHGRTMAAVSATAQPKYHVGFEPMLPGFTYVPHNDLQALAEAIDAETTAVMIEPIQGEGGVNMPAPGYLEGIRQLCDQHGLLLIFDEVQTGLGRTGEWFAHHLFGVTPDILTCAKALAAGVAAGVTIARPEVAAVLKPGMHASTFGGNPIACRAGIATIETIEADGLLDRAREVGHRFRTHYEAFRAELPELIRDIRIAGVMIGLELTRDATGVVADCMEHGLLINVTHATVIRLLPAMNLTDEQIDDGCAIIGDALRRLAASAVENQVVIRHFIDLFDVSASEAKTMLDLAAELKAANDDHAKRPQLLAGRMLGLVFDKPSLRTRVSFEAAITQLGGNALFLPGKDVGMGSRETVADFARVISQYVDALAVRTFSQTTIEELARHATIPIINALSDSAHPCQALADLMTLQEEFGWLAGLKFVFVGDGNNVARSLAQASALFGVNFVLACPPGYAYPTEFAAKFATTYPGVELPVEHDPAVAVQGADAVYTDVWASMGQEAESESRKEVFAPYRVDADLMAQAKPSAIFLHCLPAHRGEEVTDTVLDGPQSRVIPEAANRLHLQKALLAWLLRDNQV